MSTANIVELFANGDAVTKGVAKALFNGSLMLKKMRVQQIPGLVHKTGVLTSEGEVADRIINQPFPVTAGSVLAPVEERIQIAGKQIKVDVRLEKASEGKKRGEEAERSTRVLGRYMDNMIVNGDGLTNNARIIGLKARLTGSQLITAGDNGDDINHEMIEDLIDAVEDQGAGKFLLMNKGTYRDLMREMAGATSQIVTYDNYEGVPIVIGEYNEAGNALLPFTETCGSSDVTASAYCIAPGPQDDSGLNILMASNSIELIAEGIRDSQYIDTLEVAFGLLKSHPRAAARLKGILRAA